MPWSLQVTSREQQELVRRGVNTANKNLLAMLKKLQKLEAAVIEFKQVENNEGLSGLVKRIKKIEAAVEVTAKEVL